MGRNGPRGYLVADSTGQRGLATEVHNARGAMRQPDYDVVAVESDTRTRIHSWFHHNRTKDDVLTTVEREEGWIVNGMPALNADSIVGLEIRYVNFWPGGNGDFGIVHVRARIRWLYDASREVADAFSSSETTRQGDLTVSYDVYFDAERSDTQIRLTGLHLRAIDHPQPWAEKYWG